MQLRLPDGGGGFLSALFDTSSTNISQGASNAVTDAVQPDQVSAAIDALGAGHVEFVGLDDDVASIQAADMPGGYVLQRSLDGGDWVDQPGPLTLEQLRAAFLSVLGGDVDGGLAWAVAEENPKQKKGWFRRK